MKKGLNQCGLPQGLTRREQFERAKKAGFEGIEFDINEELPQSEVDEIKSLIKEFELPVTSLMAGSLWQYNLTSNDENNRNKAKELIKYIITLAKELGADTVLVVPGVVNEDVTYNEAYENAYNSLIEMKPFIEKMQIYVGIENVWNKFLTTAYEMRDFIDKIDCEYVGAYFDIGNVLINGYPEYWIEILGKRIKKVHIKDFKTNAGGGGFFGFVDLGAGEVNWTRVMDALRKIGYDDYLSCEVVPYGFCPQTYLENMSRIFDDILAM